MLTARNSVFAGASPVKQQVPARWISMAVPKRARGFHQDSVIG
jgi:hypothetical protein